MRSQFQNTYVDLASLNFMIKWCTPNLDRLFQKSFLVLKKKKRRHLHMWRAVHTCFSDQHKIKKKLRSQNEFTWKNFIRQTLLSESPGAVDDTEGSPVPTLKLYKSIPNSFLWGFILTREIAVCCHLPLLLPSMSLKIWQPYFIFLLPSVTVSL